MDIIIIWIIIGMLAGILASLASAGLGYGIFADAMVGVAGACLCGWIFHEAGWRAPISGLPGAAVVAFLGAVIALVALRLFKRLGTAPAR